MEKVDINILDRAISLTTEPQDKEALLLSAKKVDELLRSIKQSSPNLAIERVAILGCLKLALDFLKMQSKEGPFSGVPVYEVDKRIAEINCLLDQAASTLD
ncbi:cell division protein ZapA [Taylorella equigenitalis]|uniref:Cell division protein ZapA n=3 Tax=Taylorella equigenitalis TaxID=29575 RepID=A0A654KHL1_TAYEM|nr:cell division protein ZapA [Taylorella equigenitalis]ADU91921.1 hypothetical protein TEQUI_0991 [Taylorella equigenitalis MCE9]AFN35484.1 hypothetical protein KUI_0392 [Taylorella equigenitalis ATCC 35865]ASY30138.1 cell division protein ZapA [Taylorella equigenitalis]ASY37444.1 cell division protein ZapA [Taylorella equigenitalis]ASY38913.1 cell division protein ZapA [Taylorella equigenitalis]